MSLWDTIREAVIDNTAQTLRLDDGFQLRDVAFWSASGTMGGTGGASMFIPDAPNTDPNAPVEASSALSDAQRALYTNVVSRPLTAALLTLDNEDSATLPGGGESWRDNWDAAQYVSPGQEIVAGFNRGQLGALGRQGAESPRDQVNRAIVNKDRLDASDPGGAFKNNQWANLVSGVSDAGFQVGLDPLSRTGQGVGKAREAVFTRTLTEKNVAKLRDEAVSGTGGVGAWLRNLSDDYDGIMADVTIRRSADPEALGSAMYLAGKVARESADEAETAYSLRSKVFLAASGDQAAVAELRATRASLADQLDTLTGASPKDPTPDLFDDLVLRDKWLAAALGEMDNAGAVGSLVGRQTASRSSVWEANKAARAQALGELRVGGKVAPVGEYFGERKFQLAPGSRTVRVLHWMGQTRPSGAIRVDGLAADGYTDLQSAALRVKSWTPEIRREWADRWAMAQTVSERSLVAKDFRRATVRAVVEEHGITGKQADDYTNKLIGRQDTVADEVKQTGYLVDGDELVVNQMLLTQLRDSVPLIDLDYLYRVMPQTAKVIGSQSAAKTTLNSVQRGGAVVVNDLNNVVDLFWRPLVLMGGGYAPRNTAEAWGRMAALGSLGRIAREQGAEGVANYFRNRAAGVGAAASKARFGADSAEYGEAARRVAEGRRMGGKGTITLPGGVVADDALEGAGGELLQEASAATTVGASLRPGDVMGGRPAINAAGETPQGQWFRLEYPASKVDDAGETVAPDAAELDRYWDGYTRIVNKQLAGDPIGKLLLGGADRAQVKAWIANNRQYGLRREYGLSKADARDRVDTIANYLDELVPDGLRPRIVETGGLSKQEYAKALEEFEPGAIPVQNIEAVVAGQASRTVADGWRALTRGVFKYIGTLPEDNLVRNPYVRDVYRRTMETNARIALRDGVTVTDEMVLGWQRQARKAALRDLKENIYTIERYSNGANALRTVAPFIAATNNTLRTWGKIIGKNPQVIGRANQIWNAPLRAGLVVQIDSEGNYQPVSSDSDGMGISSAYGMVIPVPKRVKDAFGVRDEFTLVPPLSSMNVALQSDPVWLPGWGPMVTLPFAYFANRNPDAVVVQKFGGFVFPSQGDTSRMQSPAKPWMAALPAEIRQTFNKEDPDGSQRTAIFATIAANEFRAAQATGDYSFFDPEGKWVQKIESETDAYFNLRIAGGLTLPFAANVQDPEAQFYIGKWREYSREGEVGGRTAIERFIADFGEQFRGYTFSASQNNTGANADVNVQRRIDNLDPALRDTLGALNPQLIGALVNNPDGSYEFSSPVLNKQKNITTGPTADLPFREGQTGAQAFNDTRVDAGWQAYIGSRKKLDAWMRQNQVTSLSTQAPQVQAAWQKYVADLQAENPAWARVYSERDEAKYVKNAQGFGLIFEADPSVGQRPEMAAVQSYLRSRETLTAYLQSGQAPAKTLTAAANAQLRASWEQYVRDLLNENERFADIYFQFFDGEFGRVESAEGL